ncbi:uncharacterized protein [Nicotiana sylvestris]|uniref:Uncharacterized protein LOC104243204 n=1 Tax=Nicotiana sylvestris TaxID=4096 RepID=A0A1U7YBN0_NICSY|nr:PREDICTED: uncharacterized protein LOC104243204 [Nicotiana sylvestris]
MEDIKEEIEFWSSVVVCFVLGSNPPQAIMEGCFQRIWGSLGIDKITQINRGVFTVRFHNFESRIKVIEDGVQMFDRKPVVVKPWSPDMDMKKESVELIPMWIRFNRLDIKYWGQVALTKLAGLKYPDTIMFEDERGRIVDQEVFYEWKPTLCGKCKNIGHEMNECRRFIKEEKEKQANKQEPKEPIENKREQGQKQQVIGPTSKGNTRNEVATIGNEVATTSRTWKNSGRGRVGDGIHQDTISTGNFFETLEDHQQEKAEAANGNVVENRNNKGKWSEMALGKGQDGGYPSSNG